MPGIYLHIPFCDTKCIYCDFYSITNHARKDEFLSSVEKEIISFSKELNERSYDSIFFGGGTPSLLSYSDLNKLFETLYKHYNISPDTEITIEANPGTLDKNKLAEFKKLPINRLSFGIQSFNDDELKYLTRIHSSVEAVDTVKSAQDAGYANINIDLIFALPNQSLQSWQDNLNKAVELDTQHISAYSLIFEEGTPLFSMREAGKAKQADIELEQQMYEYTMEFLSSKGFQQYEISNYAKTGYECRHNLKYWTLEEYIAFGPSASSYIGNKRWTNARNIGKYIELIETGKPAYDFIETIDKETSITEHIMLGLRSRGIFFNDFKTRYNIDFKANYSKPINLLITNGFAELTENHFRLTPKGYAVCDEIAAKYF